MDDLNGKGFVPRKIVIPKFSDDRGFFSTLFKSSEDPYETGDYQVNMSFSERNVFRGLHFSNGVQREGKFVFCLAGYITGFAWDLKNEPQVYHPDSESPENFSGYFVPHGYAHGFLARQNSIVLYVTTKTWKLEDECNLSYKSPVFYEVFKRHVGDSIDNLILSKKDLESKILE